jgi:hypothetical protein
MSRIVIVILTYHRHKPIDIKHNLVYLILCTNVVSILELFLIINF